MDGQINIQEYQRVLPFVQEKLGQTVFLCIRGHNQLGYTTSGRTNFYFLEMGDNSESEFPYTIKNVGRVSAKELTICD